MGSETSVSGKTHLACIEGKNIVIGDDCMFSSDIILRTGDSHSVVDLQNNRINPSKSIEIGNHVWIGNKVTVNKGVFVPNNSIIGTGAVVTKTFENGNIIIAGNPAKIIKSDINWDRRRM